MGDLIAWVAQSALNIVHVSASCQSAFEGTTKDDRVSQTLSHLVKLVCRSTTKCRSDRWPVRLQTRTETERFITEDDTSPRSAKIQSTLPMMWGQWSVLADVGSSSFGQSSPLWFLLWHWMSGRRLNRC
ncbi:hypothetical protein TNCV_4556941 [Trichonephila clavipes]|nr:hypothetical protein TNCV_4556941 [Trichonephila clavipes]